MNVQHFVILILCRKATLDDLMEERRKHQAIPVDILHYQPDKDYFKYREQKVFQVQKPIDLMFVFGGNDSVIVRSPLELAAVRQRLVNNEC